MNVFAANRNSDSRYRSRARKTFSTSFEVFFWENYANHLLAETLQRCAWVTSSQLQLRSSISRHSASLLLIKVGEFRRRKLDTSAEQVAPGLELCGNNSTYTYADENTRTITAMHVPRVQNARVLVSQCKVYNETSLKLLWLERKCFYVIWMRCRAETSSDLLYWSLMHIAASSHSTCTISFPSWSKMALAGLFSWNEQLNCSCSCSVT